MDLIAAFTSQLGMDTDKAQGLAGSVLGALQQQVSQKLGASAATALTDQIPEIEQWKARAAALGRSEGGAGGLLGAARVLLGGGSGTGGLDIAALVQQALQAGATPAAAKQLLPLLLQFLQARLDPTLLSKITAAVPALSGSSNKGGLLGALGGILGG